MTDALNTATESLKKKAVDALKQADKINDDLRDEGKSQFQKDLEAPMKNGETLVRTYHHVIKKPTK